LRKHVRSSSPELERRLRRHRLYIGDTTDTVRSENLFLLCHAR